MYTVYYDTPYLMHHGIKGMRWGVRRYQNNDGSLKPAGKTRYGKKGLISRGNGGKRTLTAAQKAERKRKLIKGAKIAAAALGTAAVVGGTAYAMKKLSAREREMANWDRDRRARNAQNEQQLRRLSEATDRSLQILNDRSANRLLRTEQDVNDYFQGTGKFATSDHNRRVQDLGDTYTRQRDTYNAAHRYRAPSAQEIARAREIAERDERERKSRARSASTGNYGRPSSYHVININGPDNRF